MCKALGEKELKLADIKYLLISHFHPDHMGIAGELAVQDVTIVVLKSQKEYVHASDYVFAKDKRFSFTPIADEKIRVVTFEESRKFLEEIGVKGCILSTPGHSDDSISLYLDSGDVFVGDLYPLYELEVHEEVAVKESWQKILSLNPKRIFYGHAKTAILDGDDRKEKEHGEVSYHKNESKELYCIVKKIMTYVDKGMQVDKIAKKLGMDKTFVNDVCRMYLTHRNVSVQGILDRIEIKGR